MKERKSEYRKERTPPSRCAKVSANYFERFRDNLTPGGRNYGEAVKACASSNYFFDDAAAALRRKIVTSRREKKSTQEKVDSSIGTGSES